MSVKIKEGVWKEFRIEDDDGEKVTFTHYDNEVGIGNSKYALINPPSYEETIQLRDWLDNILADWEFEK